MNKKISTHIFENFVWVLSTSKYKYKGEEIANLKQRYSYKINSIKNKYNIMGTTFI